MLCSVVTQEGARAMQITTLPVYSKLADEAAIPKEIAQRLPAGWQLSQHQLETFQAL